MVTPIVTPQQVRDRMLGLKEVLDSVDQDALDALIDESIMDVQGEIEQDTHIWLSPRVVKCNPDPALVLGKDYDVAQDYYDFYQSNYRVTGQFNLRNRPIISVQRVAVEYGVGQAIMTYPADWIRLDKHLGRLSVVPITGGVSGNALGILPLVYWLPMLSGAAMNGVVPQLVAIDVTAGIQDAASAPEWQPLRTIITRAATLAVRESLSELIPSSASRDGVSISIAPSAQTTEKIQKDLEDFKRRFRRANAPVNIEVV